MFRRGLITPTYRDAIRESPGIASHWRMGEASGSVLDSVGSVSGTENGTVVRNAAPVIALSNDGSIDFDGSSGYISFSDTYDFTGTASFTVAAWIYPDTLGSLLRIVDKDNGTDGWHLAIDTTGTLRGMRRTSSVATVAVTPANVIATAQRTFVAMAYNGSQIALYVNGSLSTNATNPLPATNSLANTAAVLAIGRRAGTAANYFDGKIDEVCIWTRALSGAEMYDLHSIGRG